VTVAIRIPGRVAGIAPAQFDALNSRAAELRAAGHDVISLGQALPGFGPPRAAVDAVRRALDEDDVHVYSADAGRLSLRKALCARLAAEAASGADAPEPADVVITAGGNQAFMLALMTLVDPGEEVLLPAPYFVNHEMAVAALGAVATEVPLHEEHGFVLRWKDLEPRLSPRTRAVVVCTPSNPTGAVVPAREMARVARELAGRGIVLVVDETYSRFVFDGPFESAAATPGWRDNVVVVNTFSKTFGMTGWRVGYMLADRRVCEEAIKIQDAMIICAPVMAQAGVEAAIREAWDHPRQFAAELTARRDALARGLAGIPRLGWRPAGGGFFAFVRVEGGTDSARLAADILERAHVVTIPGSTFGRSGEGFLRLSFSAATCDEIARACARLRAFFS
jgi:aspartate/methionine/tyrosine aminotransferase